MNKKVEHEMETGIAYSKFRNVGYRVSCYLQVLQGWRGGVKQKLEATKGGTGK